MLRAALVVTFWCALFELGLSSGGYEMPFECQTDSGNDLERQGALNLINGIRSSVALGEFEAQNFLPSASDMRKLRWDCNLESIAQSVVQNCSSNMPQASGPNGINYYYFAPGTPEPILRNATQSAVLEWIEIKSVLWPQNNIFDGNPLLRDFANMIRAITDAVGCSSTMCGNRASAACVFSQPTIQAGTLVYTYGEPCQTDSDCTAIAPAFCECGLCGTIDVLSTTPLPTTTRMVNSTTRTWPATSTTDQTRPTRTWPATSTTDRTWPTRTWPATSTTDRTWPTRTWPATSTDRTWPTRTWPATSTDRTWPTRTWPTRTWPTRTWPATSMTTPRTKWTTTQSTICQNKAIDDAFRMRALRLHNNFRSVVATGQARNGEYANENAPPSTRMNALAYDCLAEQFAHNHVRTCNRRLSSPLSRPGYQENIHVLQTTLTDVLGAIQDAVTTWKSELAANGIPSNMIFTSQLSQRRQRTVTRVTKVIWGTNRYVGCATQRCRGFYFTSCMYREPVNVIGQNIYTIGAVCGHCPGGMNRCDPTVGLCYS